VAYFDYSLHHLEETSAADAQIHVLIQFEQGRLAEIEAIGFLTTSAIGDIAAGAIRVDSLPALREHPAVVLAEVSRPPKIETDVSSVAINLFDPRTNANTILGKGRGALIGVIDSGFELTHPAFLGPNNKTRIVCCWDQANILQHPGTPPTGFGYGIEYTAAMIDAATAANQIISVEHKKTAANHGTYVTGIAAGNGTRHGTYRGMAPEAELILVTYRNDVFVDDSAFILDAIEYIRRKAEELRRPVVINMSIGDNLGAHDGTSPLEKAIDYLVDRGRTLVVKSAGNEHGQLGLSTTTHARSELTQGQVLAVPFELTPKANNPIDGDALEIWYRRGDRIAVALQPPGGTVSTFIEPGTSGTITFPSGNRALVSSQVDHPANGDNHIGIVFLEGAGWVGGTWNLFLRGNVITRGEFDIWTDRPNGLTNIAFTRYQEDAVTITLPGTSRRVITVGGFVSRPEQRGETGEMAGVMSMGSSTGPTRDGRVKPDISAPSSLIMAPRLRTDLSPVSYDMESGTSMAAPHVTGVIALLWALLPNLTSHQIRAALIASAHNDTFTGATPNTSWGYGKLDAGAAYHALTTFGGGDLTMSEIAGNQMQVELETAGGEFRTVTVRFEVHGGRIAGLKGIDEDGTHYDVDMVFSRSGGGECFVCLNTPCPPNRYQQVDPCPMGIVRKEQRRK